MCVNCLRNQQNNDKCIKCLKTFYGVGRVCKKCKLEDYGVVRCLTRTETEKSLLNIKLKLESDKKFHSQRINMKCKNCDKI